MEGFSKEILDPGQEMNATGVRGEYSVTKPQNHLRKHPRITELKDKSRGQITDFSGKHKVELLWNLNEDANRDKVFKLKVDEKVVYLDLDELTFYTRAMFN